MLRERADSGLAMWRARRCVVLGRFQNPWREVYWQKLAAQRALLVRRQSGGGTVYQDEGNLNFAFFGSLKDLDKRRNLEVITGALASLGIPLEIGERDGLFYKHHPQDRSTVSVHNLGQIGGKQAGATETCSRHVAGSDSVADSQDGLKCEHLLKVSGSAFKQTKDRFLHHGTLLVNADLGLLKTWLHPPSWNIQTKAAGSRRSLVTNLKDIAPRPKNLTGDKIIWAIARHFGASVRKLYSKDLLAPKTLAHFSSPQWIWGETPPFEWVWGRHRLSFRRAQLEKVVPLDDASCKSGQLPQSELKFLQERHVWRELPKFHRELETLVKQFGSNQIHQLKLFWGAVPGFEEKHGCLPKL